MEPPEFWFNWSSVKAMPESIQDSAANMPSVIFLTAICDGIGSASNLQKFGEVDFSVYGGNVIETYLCQIWPVID